MKRLGVLLVLGALLASTASANGGDGVQQIVKTILPAQVEIGGRITTYDGGEAAGFALNGLYDLFTASRAVPRYLGIAFEQLSDPDANLKTLARAEFLWEPFKREIFGVVIGGGGSGENFSVEDTDWGWHYAGGVTLELGTLGKLMMTYRSAKLKIVNGTIGAGFVAALPQ